MWHNFGDARPADEIEATLTRAFDLGITHFDLANNYGPPYGSAETNVGKVLRGALAPYRDELILSTKAGWDMWPGPYGDGGSRKYLLASLDASLKRMGVEYVDIFYSHRYDHETPLEETMGALDTAVRQGKALYAGISSYPPDQTVEAAGILARLGTPLLIHQPPYSMFNRWIEHGLLDTFGRLEVGCIVFSPLAQGLLTDRYLEGIPEGSRASRPASSLDPAFVTDELRDTGPVPRRDRPGAGPVPGPDGPGLDGPGSPGDLHPHRGQQPRAAGAERGHPGRPGLLRRGAGGHRGRPGRLTRCLRLSAATGRPGAAGTARSGTAGCGASTGRRCRAAG